MKKELEQFNLEFGTNYQVDVVGGQCLLQTAPSSGYSGDLVYQRQDYSHLISQLDQNNLISVDDKENLEEGLQFDYNLNIDPQGAVSLQNFDPQDTVIFDRNSNVYYNPVTGTCFDYYADTDKFVPYQ